jgi:hypothetical protein
MLEDQNRHDSLVDESNRRMELANATRGSVVRALSNAYAVDDRRVGVNFSVGMH